MSNQGKISSFCNFQTTCSNSYPTAPPPSYDPGWNDPPKVAYSQNSPAQHNKLNKRIAFPLQGVQPADSPIIAASEGLLPTSRISSAQGPPPPPISQSLPVTSPPKANGPPPLPPTKLTGHSEVPNTEPQLETVRETFQKIVNGIEKREEITSRLTVMYDSWSGLDSSVKKILVDLGKSLESGNHQQGMTLHRSLIVNHGAVCKLWAPALRWVKILK
jgi:Steroid receptor RNA activator (SRA1)